ncbi:protein of unknown function (plasmid) [Azospirillum baldaniorum]|uniref:Uncharacterized protein n=1 Tax=Azospirillum baldaniorum TaxID=1064539 RepID=A0A9P1NRW1_9PROT|nr:protein of unknown function [Azospirillum baldaniorum]
MTIPRRLRGVFSMGTSGKKAVDHPHRGQPEEQGEDAAQDAGVEAVGEPRAERRHRHGGRQDQRKPQQVDVAQAEIRAARHVPAGQHEAHRSRHTNDEAQRRRRADRAVDRVAEQGQDGDAERAAADAHHRRHHADAAGQPLARRAARQPVGDAPLGLAEQHVQRDQDRHPGEHRRQHRAAHHAGHRRSRQHAEEDRRPPGAQQVAVHGAAPPMGAQGGERGGDDGGQRGADRDVHAHGLVHAQHGEQVIEHRHDHDAAAHPHHAGRQPGETAGQQQPAAEDGKLRHRRDPQPGHGMPRHICRNPLIFMDIRLFPLVSHPFANAVPTGRTLRISVWREDGRGVAPGLKTALMLGKRMDGGATRLPENGRHPLEKQQTIVTSKRAGLPLHSCATSACCAGIHQYTDDMRMLVKSPCMPRRGDGGPTPEPLETPDFRLGFCVRAQIGGRVPRRAAAP